MNQNIKNKRLNFAVLMNMNFNIRYTKNLVWNGMSKAAKDLDVNLYCIDGKPLKHRDQDLFEQNLIYDLIDPNEFDGIIIWASTIGPYVKKQELESFIKKYRSVPLVIGESVIEDIPSVHFDYQQMMDLVIGHLVKEHKYKKIALMQGPEYLDYSRLIKQAYKKSLSDYNIPYDPKLVSDPCMRWYASSKYFKEMLKNRNLRLKEDIEAIITIKAVMTMRIYEELQCMGKYIPYDVALVGLTNSLTLSQTLSDVTVVRPSFFQMGFEAVKMLYDICLGQTVEKIKKIPVELIPSQSCGCHIYKAEKTQYPVKSEIRFTKFNNVKLLKEKLLSAMQTEISRLSGRFKSGFDFSDYLNQLVDAYISEFYQNSQGMLYMVFDKIMHKIIMAGNCIDEWLFLCAEFRNKTLCYMLADENISSKLVQAEKIWYKIFLLISEAKSKAGNIRNNTIINLQKKFVNISNRYLLIVNLDEFIKILVNEFPKIFGIKNGYLVLFENQDNNTIKKNGNNINIGPYTFITFSNNKETRKNIQSKAENCGLFVPDEITSDNQSHCFIIKPLFFHEKKMGFLALSAELDYINIYERLRRDLSIVFYRLDLFKKIEENTLEIVRQKKLLDTFFATIPGRICMRDNNGKIIRVNHAYARWHGFTHRDELIGKTNFDLMDEIEAEKKNRRENEIIATGKPVLDLEENISNSWALTTIMPLCNEKNKIFGIMEIARDITDTKKTQDELRKYRNHLEDLVKKRTEALQNANVCLHEEITERIRIEDILRTSDRQYRLLAETVQDGIMIIQQNKIIFANQILQEMIEYTQDELKNLDFINFFKLNRLKNTDNQSRAKKEKYYKPLQREVITKNNKSIWFDIDRKPIVWNGNPALLLTLHNITGRIKKEQDLENERAKLEQENINLKSSIKERYRFGEIIGKSPLMQHVYELIVNAASAVVNVLIVGESGTGKELIARTIHRLSPRKNNPFVPVNCASIPDTLFEREFFGHVKGAFTGADQTKPGFFDYANNGILFLDEVTELNSANQAKLLRVLQDGEYVALGSAKPKKADVLIIAVTNKNVPKEIKNGNLRKDFFYRIGVIDINVPPLRERKEDLPLLIEHILNNYKKRLESIHGKKIDKFPQDYSMFPGKLVQEMYRYSWPGNIRELQNVVQKYLATGNPNILFSSISTNIESEINIDENINFQDKSLSDILKIIEKKYINNTLQNNHFSIVKTAKILKMPLRTLHRRLEEYGLKS